MLKKYILIVTIITTNIFAMNPNFEIWNKTFKGISTKVIYKQKNRINPSKIEFFIHPNGKMRIPNVDFINATTFVSINKGALNYEIQPCKTGCYKTAYLSFDKTGLRPQKGTWNGILGTTNSGYDNSENINQYYIVQE